MSTKYYIYKKDDYEKVVDGLKDVKKLTETLGIGEYNYIRKNIHFLLKEKYGKLIARTMGGFRPVLFQNGYIDNSSEFMGINKEYVVLDEYDELYEYDRFLAHIVDMSVNTHNKNIPIDAEKDEYGFYWSHYE